MDLQTLFDTGEELKNVPYDSPRIDMWKNDVKAEVAKYGDATSAVLENAFHFGFVISSEEEGQEMHREMISKVQELLIELQKRNPADTLLQSRIINQKKEEAKASIGAKFGKTTFNGPVTFGDNSPANNLQVGELMLAIISEVEKTLPDGTEKVNILTKLKEITANPTFAAVAGAALPEIIRHLFGS
jgi:hypothetical protein